MAQTIPFLVRLQVVLTALSVGQVSYPVNANEQVEITDMWQKSTGAFDITGISDSTGKNYSNASSGGGLDSDFIQDVATSNRAMHELPVSLLLPGSVTLTINVVDTSNAGNTVEIMLSGKRIIQ